jgi:hypothetical protein
MVPRLYGLVVIVIGLSNRLANCQEQSFLAVPESARSPFLAAEIGSFPKCKVYGRTYCLDAQDYPK